MSAVTRPGLLQMVTSNILTLIVNPIIILLNFFQMNPQHTIPVIVDNGFVLSESRAILGYLAEKYAKDSTYYPSDPMARGVVNQRLMFDIGTLYQRLLETYMVR